MTARSARSVVRQWLGRPWENRATQTYAVLIAANALWLREANRRLAQAALHITSTNLDRLGHDPVSVLITSAFWVAPSGWRATVTLIAALLLILGPVERRIGTTRWLAAFAAGHIGATLLVALGLIIGVRTGHIDASVAHSIDVGWSYGGVCLTGVLTYLVPCRWRGTYAAVLLAAVATGLWLNRSFTDWGHLTSALIGLAFGPKVAARRTTATTSAGERSTRVAHGDRTRGPVKMLVYVEQVAPLVLGHTPDSCLGEKRPGLVQRGEHHIPATDVVCNERKEPQQ